MKPREMCRNPNCGMKLKAPTENKHHAFCTVGCYEQFFRHRCVVCECTIKRSPNAWHKRTCGKRNCRNLLRNSGDAYRSLYPSAKYVMGPLRSAHEMGVNIPWRERPRIWKVLAGNSVSHINLIVPLDQDTKRRVENANAQAP
jgi:hypothetical protein